MPLIPPNPIDANTYLPGTLVTPGSLLITAITNTNPMVITITDSDVNTYIVGQLVRLDIPQDYGMIQADGLTGQIMEIDETDFSVSINSTMFDTFVIPPEGNRIIRPASLSPAGSRNLSYSNTTNQVAFQNLNNEGN